MSRRRGWMLTDKGISKLREAIRAVEETENYGEKLSQDELISRVDLDPATITKIRYRQKKCDLKSIERLYSAFGLILQEDDYYQPFAEPDHKDKQVLDRDEVFDQADTDLSCIITDPNIFMRELWYKSYIPQTISSYEHSLNLAEPVSVDDVFQFNTSLVITGESGTGKSVFLKSCFIKACNRNYKTAYVDLAMEYTIYDSRELSNLILKDLESIDYIFIDSVDEYFPNSSTESIKFITSVIYQNSRLSLPLTIVIGFRKETLFPTSTSYLAFRIDSISREDILTRLHSFPSISGLYELSNSNYISIFERPIFLTLLERLPSLNNMLTSCASIFLQVINEEFKKARLAIFEPGFSDQNISDIEINNQLWSILKLITEHLSSDYYLSFIAIEDICSAYNACKLFEYFLSNSCFFQRNQFGFRLSNPLLLDFICAIGLSDSGLIENSRDLSADSLLFTAGLAQDKKVFSLVLDEARTRSISLALRCIRDSPLSLGNLTVSIIRDAIETYVEERSIASKLSTATSTQFGIRPLGFKAGEALLELCKDNIPVIRAVAIYISSEVGFTNPEFINQILQISLDDNSLHARYHALDYLWQLREHPLVREEIKLLSSNDVIISGYAYAIVHGKPNADYESLVIDMLVSEDLEIAHHAADYLYYFGTEQAIQPLVGRVEADLRWMVRARSLRALSKLPFLPTREFIMLTSKDPDCDVRYFSIQLLSSKMSESFSLLSNQELKELADVESELPNQAEIFKLIAQNNQVE